MNMLANVAPVISVPMFLMMRRYLMNTRPKLKLLDASNLDTHSCISYLRSAQASLAIKAMLFGSLNDLI